MRFSGDQLLRLSAAGGEASHADAVVGLADRILRISGNLSERRVYGFRRR